MSFRWIFEISDITAWDPIFFNSLNWKNVPFTWKGYKNRKHLAGGPPWVLGVPYLRNAPILSPRVDLIGSTPGDKTKKVYFKRCLEFSREKEFAMKEMFND